MPNDTLLNNDPPKTILVVDDLPDIREIFSIKLTGAGYHIETAENGLEAIKKVKELRPDLVLLDVKMPGMSGEDVLAALRADPTTCFTKVIFTTNLGDPGQELAVEALSKKFGADGYIRKTEDLEKLVSLVAEYIKK